MFTDPKHPYAQALINSLPSLDNKGVFQGIPGLAPSLLRLPSGCAFHPRCPHAMDICKNRHAREVDDAAGRTHRGLPPLLGRRSSDHGRTCLLELKNVTKIYSAGLLSNDRRRPRWPISR